VSSLVAITLAISAVACGGNSSEGAHTADGSVTDGKAHPRPEGGTGDAGVADGGAEASMPEETGSPDVGGCVPDAALVDGGQCVDPGSCGSSCSTPGVVCEYPATSLTAVCCDGTWNCTGI
jgi:hypothetical protein